MKEILEPSLSWKYFFLLVYFDYLKLKSIFYFARFLGQLLNYINRKHINRTSFVPVIHWW
jgi:hypothetical protein